MSVKGRPTTEIFEELLENQKEILKELRALSSVIVHNGEALKEMVSDAAYGSEVD